MAGYNFSNALMEEGAVPAGVEPKSIVEEGGKPGWYSKGPLANALRTVTQFMKKRQEEEETRLKNLKTQTDIYNTLREAGYNPKDASEAARSHVFPKVEPGETIKEKEISMHGKYYDYLKEKEKPERERILNKVANDEELTAGEQKIYDEIIKHKGPSDNKLALDGAIAENKKAQTEKTKAQTQKIAEEKKPVVERIKEKVAGGIDLSPGEQKIYDEVIKKEQGSENLLESALGDKVSVWDPSGTAGFIPKAKLQAALKKGFKIRK